ncbi:NAD-dependent epimerase/dehydratase family protein [Polaromonas sp. YR568]|uniref:NAD-dependent epimerase/dehydratase family protein n=1 Tax=Polaromonas sp. YR568 TaxID=1855301 RepID=UPI00398C1973
MKSLEGMKVLVTGASGFLGSVVAADLLACGADVLPLAGPKSGRSPAQAKALGLDLSDMADVQKLDVLGRFDAVVHCAAVLPGGMGEPGVLLENQKMTHNLLEWVIRANTGHFVLASTCRVYGAQSSACGEDAPLCPPDLYAVGKAACELMSSAMLAPHAIPCCSLRVSAPYGPRAKAKTVIHRFLHDAAAGLPLVLNGTGSRSQDFVFESDVADAFRQAIAARATGRYNLSGNQAVSSRELALAALELFGRDPATHLVFAGADAQENYRGRFPTDAAFAAFGFSPRVSLKEGLHRTATAWGLL